MYAGVSVQRVAPDSAIAIIYIHIYIYISA